MGSAPRPDGRRGVDLKSVVLGCAQPGESPGQFADAPAAPVGRGHPPLCRRRPVLVLADPQRHPHRRGPGRLQLRRPRRRRRSAPPDRQPARPGRLRGGAGVRGGPRRRPRQRRRRAPGDPCSPTPPTRPTTTTPRQWNSRRGSWPSATPARGSTPTWWCSWRRPPTASAELAGRDPPVPGLEINHRRPVDEPHRPPAAPSRQQAGRDLQTGRQPHGRDVHPGASPRPSSPASATSNGRPHG